MVSRTGLVEEFPRLRASAAPGDLPETARGGVHRDGFNQLRNVEPIALDHTDPATGYREPPMSRVRPLGRPPPTYPPGRYCATDSCAARLSIYNPSDHCGLHSPGRHPFKRSR